MRKHPVHDKQFDAFKAAHGGSYLAFHGSGCGNWFNILHNGLKNFSGTAHQINGAAYGQGIYFSPAMELSAAYSAIAPSTDHYSPAETAADLTPPFDVKTLRVIALCEIIHEGTYAGTRDIWIQPRDDFVCVRMLFVYQHNRCPSRISEIRLDTNVELLRDVHSVLGQVIHDDPQPPVLDAAPPVPRAAAAIAPARVKRKRRH